MADPHISFDLLTAAEEGVLSRDNLLELYVLHLRTLCPTCDVAIQAYADDLEDEAAEAAGLAPEDLPPKRLDPTLPDLDDEELVDSLLADRRFRRLPAEIGEGLRRAFVSFAARLRAEDERAERERRELVRLVDDGRGEEAVQRVERSRTRFRTVGLAHLLLDEVRGSLPDRPARALHLARAAHRVAYWLDRDDPSLRLLSAAFAARALAHQGNALRALDRLPEADRVFEEARATLRAARTVEPELVAEVDALEGSLRRAQRRFAESERLLRRAAAQYAAADDALGLARTLLKLGSLYATLGRPRETLASVEASLRAMPPEASSHLRLCAEHNRIDSLCDLGHFDVAADLLADARGLYDERKDSWTHCRLAWVEGKIAHGQGQPERARERLEAAREGFRAADAAYDTALVSLELAELHLEAGRPEAARVLAEETVALFRALEIPRETSVALAQLRRAVEAEHAAAGSAGEAGAALTVALLRATARALRHGAG